MSTKAIGNKKHLTLADRAAIEHGIGCGENFTQIALRINKDSSTISKEIRRHLFCVPHFQNETQRKRSECKHYQNCEKLHVCHLERIPSNQIILKPSLLNVCEP